MSEGAPSAPSSPGPSSSQHADQGQEKEGRGRGKGGKGKDSDKEVVALQVNYNISKNLKRAQIKFLPFKIGKLKRHDVCILEKVKSNLEFISFVDFLF